MRKLLYFLKTPLLSRVNCSLKPYSRFQHFPRPYASASPPGKPDKISLPISASVKLPTVDGLARSYWIKFNYERTQALFTPFVVCLASGTLEIDTLRHYMVQNVHFLRAIAQAYQRVEEYAADDSGKYVVSKLRKAVFEELKSQELFVQEFAFGLDKEIRPTAATVALTEFLLVKASGKVEGMKASDAPATPLEKTKLVAYTLSAMTPCMMLYAFLGRELRASLHPSQDSHLYQKWICNYSSDNFQAAAVKSEHLFEDFSAPLTTKELEILEKRYHQALKLELEFFLAQPLDQKTVVPLSKEHNPARDCIMFFSDFDLTCSIVDSSSVLAEIAIIKGHNLEQNKSVNQLTQTHSAGTRAIWGELSKQYTEGYEQCIESILLSDPVENFNYEGLCKALQHLSDFEKNANSVVIDSGVLKGLNAKDIEQAAESLILQDGCLKFFQSTLADKRLNSSIHILSSCWCGDLIRSVFSSGALDSVSVHANEFIYENSLSTGEFIKNMESPIDKLEAFTKILRNHSSNRKNLAIYIGDSVGDLFCLLEADVGIVIGSSSSLQRLGTHFGISFAPLFPGVIEKQKQAVDERFPGWKGRSGVLYTVTSWAEVRAFVLGC